MHDRVGRTGLRLIACPAATGAATAVGFVGAFAWVSGPDTVRLLFATSHGLGAAMLIAALAGLFGCAAFATLVALEAPRTGRGLAQPCPARISRARTRSS
jgi:hypothetical protein